jgi:cytochrome oxidase assembly protein ShyY1
MKPVTLSGYLDHQKELKIEKTLNGEKGFEVITPFYTHLDANNQPCAIFVNRGWIAKDLHKFRFDRNQEAARVRGVLYRGDAKTKYTEPNSPINN